LKTQGKKAGKRERERKGKEVTREGEKRERGNKREREETEKLTVQKSAISRTMTTTKLATKDLEKRPQRM
jgi:phage-related minor tail protein